MPDRKDNLDYVGLDRPTIFAHRGSSAYAPENTLTAFKLALDQGADAIELDAKLAADGEVVVIHDDTVDRTTTGTGRIKALTLAQIKDLDAGSKMAPSYEPEKIPALAEVFEDLGGKIFINVELTNYSSPLDDLPDKVAALVSHFNLENHVLFSSFNIIALMRARSLLPKVPVGLLTFRSFADIVLRSKLVRFGPLLAIHPDHRDVSPVLIRRTHNARSRVHAYTVNDPDRMRQLLLAGVDGIFTDDPPLAQKIIAECIP